MKAINFPSSVVRLPADSGFCNNPSVALCSLNCPPSPWLRGAFALCPLGRDRGKRTAALAPVSLFLLLVVNLLGGQLFRSFFFLAVYVFHVLYFEKPIYNTPPKTIDGIDVYCIEFSMKRKKILNSAFLTDKKTKQFPPSLKAGKLQILEE